MSNTKLLALSALLFVVFGSINASAGTISCVDEQGVHRFRQQLIEGGAPPPAELVREHWFIGDVEQPDGFDAYLAYETKDVWETRRLSRDYQMEVSSITAVIGGTNVTMYCFSQVYVGVPRP